MKRVAAMALVLGSLILFCSTLLLQQHELLMEGEASLCGQSLRGTMILDEDGDVAAEQIPSFPYVPIAREIPK